MTTPVLHDDTADRTSGAGPSPRAILWAVGFSVFVAADDLTVVSTMLRPIIGDLGLVLPDGLDDAAWVVNAYLIAFIAVMPLAGRVSDVIGRRRTFVIAYLIFLVGTIWIPLSDSLGPFLVGRVMTAIGGGAMVPVALAVVGDVYAPEKRARALGTLGAIETMGWVWGPLYGAILVRFFSWRLQFWLNVPLAIVGLVAVWYALADHDRPERTNRIDWLGAVLLTVALVSLNLALLGSAEVQSVQGLDELTGNGGTDLRLLYPVALLAGIAFVIHQRRTSDPLVDAELFSGRNVRVALIVNFVVGAALVIAMVDVPLFVNAIEVDLERSAVIAGWILSALTAAMALASYLGGRFTERTWYGPPIVLGLVASTTAYGLMGFTWGSETPYPLLALQLAVLGAGFGLTMAPTTSAVVDHAAPEHRGSAAGVVMVVRLLGLSVGLSALTAWGLARFNSLRGDIDLPPLNDPGFEAALRAASNDLTSSSIAETFVATAFVLLIGLVLTAALLRRAHHRLVPVRPDSTQHATARDDDPMPTMEATMPEPDLTDTDRDPDAELDTGLNDAVPHDVQDVGAEEFAPTAEMPIIDSSTESTDDPVPDTVVAGSWIQRHVGAVLAVFAVAMIGAFVLIAMLFARLSSTQDDLDAANAKLETSSADIARVEAGAALFASQVTGFQDQLTELQPTIAGGLDEAVAGLQTFSESTLEFTVNIDENVEINTDVVIDRTLQVPINTTLPIDETLDTTIKVDGPFGTEIPLSITVPIELDIPIDLTVEIPINETIPVNADVPVKVDVPIGVEVAETQLADLANSLATGLESFTEILEGLGG